jgi:hypothetical protein
VPGSGLHSVVHRAWPGGRFLAAPGKVAPDAAATYITLGQRAAKL